MYIVGYTEKNYVLQWLFTVKQISRPYMYIRQYTSLNENFEYDYPLRIR